MPHAILMPKPGQMTEECTVIMWLKAEGDHVARGDVLFEIETDKSAMEVEAFDEGVLLRIVVPAGTTVPVSTVCAWVGEAGEEIPETAPVPVAAADPAAAEAAPVVAEVVTPAEAKAAAGAAPAPTGGRLRISPRASRAAADAGLDPRMISGSGPEGRITEKDVVAAVVARDAALASIAPAATAPAARQASPAPSALPLAVPGDGEEDPRPLSRMRRVIADRLTASWTTSPHFTVTVAVDVTRLLALRAELKAAGTSLTVTDFVLAATAQTLAEFPDVNSRTDGVMMWPRRRVHLGVAVSVPGGLVVPVIRDADRVPVTELHDTAVRLATGARNGTLSPDELSGSTFTVSNLGMFGVEEFSAIINPGEAAILAVSSAIPTVTVVGDGMAIRTIMKLTLSADHRIVDGELGARFLGALRRRLEDAAAFRDEIARA